MKEEISNWFKALQDGICAGLEDSDGKGIFRQDHWDRPGGGGGRSRIISNGGVIEKGGVNFSEVSGSVPQALIDSMKIASGDFYATGVSIVIHPINPWVPIIHMNVRYFEMSDGTSWFGGGMDLTPHYVQASDARFFHHTLSTLCNRHNSAYYPRFKKWADDYFFITHRKETRGIGGIFFDHLSQGPQSSKDQIWHFVQDVGNAFLPIYTELINRNKNQKFTDQQKEWQYLRRGRYTEFNLVLDKGTKFGLETDGSTESILMSLPPQARWEYNHQPDAQSLEGQTLTFLQKDINWLDNA